MPETIHPTPIDGHCIMCGDTDFWYQRDITHHYGVAHLTLDVIVCKHSHDEGMSSVGEDDAHERLFCANCGARYMPPEAMHCTDEDTMPHPVRQFLEQLARMTADGEDNGTPEGFYMESQDAAETLSYAIMKARALLSQPQD